MKLVVPVQNYVNILFHRLGVCLHFLSWIPGVKPSYSKIYGWDKL